MSQPDGSAQSQSYTSALIGILRDYARRWTNATRRDPLLIGFLLASFLAFNAMIVLNVLDHPFVSLAALPVVLPLVWVFFYGGIFLAMVFVAQHSEAPSPPEARRPRAELAVLLLYLGVMFLALYLRTQGMKGTLPARALGAVMEQLDRLDRQVLGALGIAASHRAILVMRNFHFFFVFPVLALLLCGNGPRALGFRAPMAKRWTMLVWLALPIDNFALMPVKFSRGAMAVAAAVCGPGLAEELMFRVGLQSRLEVAMRKAVHAMIVSSLCFAVIHLASVKSDPMWAVVNAMGPKLMVGFLLGYMWYRTRSLLPVVLLHGTLDVAFFAGGW